MSIYATLWKLQFPREGDPFLGSGWVEVTAQGVPPHIGSPTSGQGYEEGDPYSDFLPPPLETDKNGDAPFMRAVVFVTSDTTKGTEQNGQEYVDPLLVITGEEYNSISFGDLYNQICDALFTDRDPTELESTLEEEASGGSSYPAPNESWPPVQFTEVELAYGFTSNDQGYGNVANLYKKTGKFYYVSEIAGMNDFEEEGLDPPSEDLAEVPSQKELGLGKPLVMRFCEKHLNEEDRNKVRDFFTKRRAYSRFRGFLEKKDLLQIWYDFENKATREALVDWLKTEGIRIAENA